MTIQIKYTDGSFGDVSGVKWHPPFKRAVSQFDETDEPGRLWITEDALFEHIQAVNALRRKYGVPERTVGRPRDCRDIIEFASAPFDIYASTEDGEPWRHNGTLVASVQYGGNDSMWNGHAKAKSR